MPIGPPVGRVSRIKIWCMYLCVVCLIDPAWGAGDTLRFRRYRIDEGLSQSTVQGIVQDNLGFMWVATQDGLNRFDGYRFTVFRPGENDSGGLSDNFIRCVTVDADGVLWVGTRGGGLNRYNADLENFQHYLPDETGFGLVHQDVTALLQVRPGELWVGTAMGLCRMDIAAGTFETVTDPVLRRAEINTLAHGTGALWVAVSGGGLYTYDPDAGTAVLVDAGTMGDVRGILTDPLETVWCVGTRGVMSRARDEDRFYPHPVPVLGRMKAEAASVYMDGRGHIWVGTHGEGMFRFSYDAPERVVQFTNQIGNDHSLTDNWVHCLAGDRTGGLWVGTGDGLAMADLTGAVFEVFRHEVGNPASLSHNLIQAVVEDDQGRLWVGTRGGGLNMTQRADPGRFEHLSAVPGDPHGLGINNVRALCADPRGYLWVGTDGAGLARMETDAVGRFVHFQPDDTDPDALNHMTVRTLHIDELGYLWVGTQGGGLNRMTPQDAVAGRNRFYKLRHDGENINSLSHDVVRAFVEDLGTPGRLFWVGTQGGGLSRVELADPTDNGFGGIRIRRYLAEDPPGRGPGHNVITSICTGVSGQLWLGTPAGLNRFDVATERFQVFKEGLPNNVVYAVQRDDANFLWLSTNRGLARFDPWTHAFKNYDVNDGLPGNEFNAGASYRAPADGKLYFGGMDGLSAFYGDRIKANNQVPEVVITDLLLFNKVVKPGKPFGGEGAGEARPAPLTRSISRTDSLRLKYDDTITLAFSALHYASPAGNGYAYRLDDLNNDWIYTDAANRLATYTNLPPGTYTFRVKACNKDGLWNEDARRLRIIIPPPPWATWWAYLLYSAAALGVVWLLARAQQAKLAHERALVGKLKQVDMLKDEFLANTSHELRTPLNGMIGLAESLLEGELGKASGETRTSLELIVQGGRRLAGLVNDILDFSKMRNNSLDLHLRALDLHTLVDVVLSLTRPLVRNKELKLINAVDTELPAVLADENRLQQILHNLVGNAVKFTDHGHVTVTAERRRDCLRVSVRDTGIGIPKEQLARIFDSFVQVDGDVARTQGGTGLGLAITRRLVAQHGSEVRVESAEGKGSCFSFDLKTADPEAVVQPLEMRESVARVAALASGDSPVEITLPRIHPETTGAGGTEGERPYHILIVDDEAVNRLVLFNHLSRMSYQLTEATNGAEALARLEEDPGIDLVLLDIMMPRLSGYEVCRHIRRQKAAHELPILFLSARNQIKDLAAGFLAGGNDYLTKPFSREELMVRLSHHLALLEANRTLARQHKALADLHARLIDTQQQLIVNEKMVSLGMLTAGVSHEINNPASYAHGSLQNLAVDLDQFRSYLFEVAGDEADSEILAAFDARLTSLSQHVALAREGTSRIRGIVMDLNTFARGEQGFMERVPLTSCIKTTLNLVKANFKESVTFQTDFADALDLMCRPAEMNQVFMNLIVNACQSIQAKVGAHPEQKGCLRISTRVVDGEGEVVFADDGEGISAEHRDHVFEPFYTTKPRGKGTGQGLAISKGIVERHGGRIEVESTPGEGAVFTIRLPLKPAG